MNQMAAGSGPARQSGIQAVSLRSSLGPSLSPSHNLGLSHSRSRSRSFCLCFDYLCLFVVLLLLLRSRSRSRGRSPAGRPPPASASLPPLSQPLRAASQGRSRHTAVTPRLIPLRQKSLLSCAIHSLAGAQASLQNMFR